MKKRHTQKKHIVLGRMALILLSLGMVFLSGCLPNENPIRNRGKDYLCSEPIPGLQVPNDIPVEPMNDQYQIP